MSTVSNEKAEKVVKEPKKPIIKKYLIINGSRIILFFIIEARIPIKNDPIILTTRVPKGNEKLK